MSIELDPSLVCRLADDLVDGEFGSVHELFQDSGVARPTVVWNPTAGGMSSKSFDFLVSFWSGRKGDDGSLPGEDQIDPADLRPALGSLLICEPTEDGEDFRIRLYGSRLALDMGRDLTGTYISDFEPGSYITTFYLACYRAVARRGSPLFTRHAPSANSFAADIKRLLLPFGDQGRVTRIVTGVESVQRRPLGRPGWSRRS